MTVTFLPATGQVHDEASRENFEFVESHALFDASSPMVSQARTLATTYQPSTSRPTLVIATFALNPIATAEYEAQVLMDSANPPTTAIATAAVTAGTVGVNGFIPVTFWVPAGFFYKFLSVLGSPVVATVFEMTL